MTTLLNDSTLVGLIVMALVLWVGLLVGILVEKRRTPPR
jgi:hypothetical protein